MELENNIHRIEGVTANCYLLVGDELTLIDAGLPKYAGTILRYVEQLGFSPHELRRILITHADVDHVGGLRELCAGSGAKVYTSFSARERLIDGARPRPVRKGPQPVTALVNLTRKFYRLKPVPPEDVEVIEPDQVIPVREGLVVISAPGHTRGHLAFFDLSSQTLFAGDALNSASGQLRVSPERVTEDPLAARQTVRQFIQLKPRYVYCGHGDLPGDQAAQELISLERGLTPGG